MKRKKLYKKCLNNKCENFFKYRKNKKFCGKSCMKEYYVNKRGEEYSLNLNNNFYKKLSDEEKLLYLEMLREKYLKNE